MLEASFAPSVKPQLDARKCDSSVHDAQTRLLSATTFGPRGESVSAKDALELLVVPRFGAPVVARPTLRGPGPSARGPRRESANPNDVKHLTSTPVVSAGRS